MEGCGGQILTVGATKKTSTYVGVHWDTARSKWRAQYYLNGVQHYIGYYDDEVEATKAYDKKVKEVAICS